MTFRPFVLAGAMLATSLNVLAAAPAAAAPSVRIPLGAQDMSGFDARLHEAARSVCLGREQELAQRLACTQAAYADARDQLRLTHGDAATPTKGR